MSDEIKTQPKTVDNLGFEAYRQFAEKERFLEGINKKPLPADFSQKNKTESLTPAPTHEEVLLGVLRSRTSALFQAWPMIKTMVLAYTNGCLSDHLGNGKNLKDLIENAPEELQKMQKEFAVLLHFATTYLSLDELMKMAYGLGNEYFKG